MADRVHGAVSGGVMQAATWADRFLGDERARVEDNRTSITVRFDLFGEERESPSLGVGTDVRISLPETEERLQLILRRDDEEERELAAGPFADPIGTRPEGAEREDLSLALRYFAAATDRDNFQLDAGVRFDDLDPDPYAGIRFRHQEPAGRWIARLVQRVRLYSSDGWESRTWLDFDRPLGGGQLLRATTSGSWLEERDGWFYGQRLALYTRVRGETLLSTEASASFRTEPAHVLDTFRLRASWARRVAREWLLLEIAPQVSWREEDDYEATPGLLLRVEIRFGAQP